MSVLSSWVGKSPVSGASSPDQTHKGSASGDLSVMRKPLVVGLAFALTLGLAVPASASTLSDSGEKQCLSPTPYVQSLAKGEVVHMPPGAGYAEYSLPVFASRRTHAPSGLGGFWMVTASVGLDLSGTFAGCTSSGTT